MDDIRPLNLEVVPESGSELVVAVKEAGLAIESAKQLLQVFDPFVREAHSLLEQSTKVTDTKLARAFRLRLKETRVKVEKTRKEAKEDSQRTGKAIDGMANIIKLMIEPEETRLNNIEKAEEIRLAEQKVQLATFRASQLQPLGVDTSFMSLGDMTEEMYNLLLENSRYAHEAKLATARKAEEDRIRAENERLKEEARIRAENERLKQEAIQREAEAKKAREEKEAADAAAKKALAEASAKAIEEAKAAAAAIEKAKAEAAEKLAAEQAKAKVEAEEAEKERLRVLEVARKEREAIEAKAKADLEKAEAIRKEQAEIARKEREAVEKAAQAERQRALDAEAKAAQERAVEQARKDAEAKAERDRLAAIAEEQRLAREKLEAEAKAAREAEVARIAKEQEDKRQAELAPDREKLLAVSAKLALIVCPDLTSPDARVVASETNCRIKKLAAWIEREASVL